MRRPYAAIVARIGHEPVTLSTHRRPEPARRAVARWLDAHPVITTRDCYWRDVGRASSGEVVRRRSGAVVAAVEATVYEASSVGDLGWTP